MHGTPDIAKGEGLIRSHDLLTELQKDVFLAYEKLEEDRESQYLRRCVVRAIFSYIEAMIESVKVEIRSTIRMRRFTGELSEKEIQTLGSTYAVGGDLGRPMPMDDNIKRTFKLAAKVWELDFKLNTGSEDFQCFRRAKESRNKLTHPHTFYDIQITDADMYNHTVAGMWTQKEFRQLFKAQVDKLLANVPEEDRKRFYERNKEENK
jgi:hypothetical protein